MKFLANENFPRPSINLLIANNIDVKSIAEEYPGISDVDVMQIAIREERTILTHDSDYGELIFRLGHKPKEGVIYFRIFDFEPVDPGTMLLDLIKENYQFSHCLTVITDRTLRQRSY